MVSRNISETQTFPLQAYPATTPLWKRFFTNFYGPALLVILLLATFLAFWQSNRTDGLQRFSGLLTALGLCALLIAPALWAIAPVVQHRNSGFPIAGPYPNTGPPPKHTQTAAKLLAIRPVHMTLSTPYTALIHYLEEHQGTASYLLATSGSNYAAPIIVETGRAVMAIGGYSGADRILTRAELITLVGEGVVRFFLLSSPRRTIHSTSLRASP